MAQTDSIDKIVEYYFSAVTKEDFTYKGKTFKATRLLVSPLLLRGTTCPVNCGGCCYRFSLDYIKSEEKPDFVSPRTIEFDGREVEVFSDLQDNHDDAHCKYLMQENGRCGIHKVNPFSCDFELIRVISRKGMHNWIGTRLFGRGWQMMRVDGVRGALCTVTPVDQKSRAEAIRKIKRLQEWTDHFGLTNTWIPEILQWAEGPATKQMVLDPNKSERGALF